MEFQQGKQTVVYFSLPDVLDTSSGYQVMGQGHGKGNRLSEGVLF